jgi:stage III sporulation protein AH
LNTKVWKKNAVLATVVLFVCVALYLNWSYDKGEAANAEADAEAKADSSAIIGISPTDDEDGAADDTSSGNGEASAGDTDKTENPYFASARLNRQTARDSSLELLRESSTNASVSQEVRDDAAEAINLLAAYAITEAEIENLVVSKGFNDCVAFIDEDGIEVVVSVPGEGLDSDDVAKILDIVIAETGYTAEQVHVVEVAD